MTWLRTIISVGILFGCERPTASSASSSTGREPTAASTSASGSVQSAPAASTSSPSAASSSASPTAPAIVTFDAEAVGAPSAAFEAVVGDWHVAEEAGARGFKEDGSKWHDGTPSATLADQAKRLYGDRSPEFLAGVKAFASFPLAVWKRDVPGGDVKISVRFFPIAGHVDQAAGIAFAIAPDGTYLGVRANALEDNLLYFRVAKGDRTIIDEISNVPTPSKTWHTLSVELRGKSLAVELDSAKRFEKTFDKEPKGRIGLWSKADSQVLFDDFKVEALSATAAPQRTPARYNPALDP